VGDDDANIYIPPRSTRNDDAVHLASACQDLFTPTIVHLLEYFHEIPGGVREYTALVEQLSVALTSVEGRRVTDKFFLAVAEALEKDYVVEAEIGRGGVAVVYRATHRESQRPVAIKVLAPTHTLKTSTRERFIREARIGSVLVHPGIVPIYSPGVHGDLAYYAMRLVEGESSPSGCRGIRSFRSRRRAPFWPASPTRSNSRTRPA
jgi:hypothetical protein